MPLDDLLCQLGGNDSDQLRLILERTVQALIEAEVAAVSKAGRHERVEERVAYRNGHRPRIWDTRVGGWSWRSPSCVRGASCPACWSPGGGSNGPSGR